jgi:hypothetical protein
MPFQRDGLFVSQYLSRNFSAKTHVKEAYSSFLARKILNYRSSDLFTCFHLSKGPEPSLDKRVA